MYSKEIILFWIYYYLNLKVFCTWQYFEIQSKAKAPLSNYFRLKLKFILFFLTLTFFCSNTQQTGGEWVVIYHKSSSYVHLKIQ